MEEFATNREHVWRERGLQVDREEENEERHEHSEHRRVP